MHIEILVEERSAAAALEVLVPRIVGGAVSFQIREFAGKDDLLNKLPNRLQAYPRWLPHWYGQQWCIVVLIDEDRQDCRALKHRLEQIAQEAGLTTRTAARITDVGTYYVVNRIAVEELEAWFFGDVEALRTAYPRVPATLAAKQKYRDPDAIGGGTHEALAAVLKSYYPAGMLKVEVAKTVAPHMEPARNRSKSFQVFKQALEELAA